MSSWIWVLIALVVVGAVAAIVIAQRRRRARAAWGNASGQAVTEGKLLVDQFRAGFAERGDAEPMLQRQLQALDSTLAGLENSAPSPDRRRAVTDARGALGGLGAALDADLQLRIGPPAPTTEQLDTSQAVMDERVRDLDLALDRLAPAPAPTT